MVSPEGQDGDRYGVPGTLGFFAWKNQQASVVQAEFLKGLCLEKIELELGQRFRRQRLNLLLDFGRQRAELGFHQPQGRPPLALLDAAFDAVRCRVRRWSS